MKKKTKLVFALLLIGYMGIFITRLYFEFNAKEIMIGSNNYSQFSGSGIENNIKNSKLNFASSRTVVESEVTNKTVVVDQKYERIANVSTETSEFEKDKGLIDEKIKKHKAIIQYENNNGVNNNRYLNLFVGVHPDKFDSFVDDIKVIGKPLSFSVTKTDKTSEYKQLEIQKKSLEKTRDALIALKSKGGNISELINLENKIVEVDKEIQGYGVNLGDFSEENELCTVKIYLTENIAISAETKTTLYGFLKIIFKAITWSLLVYIGILVMISLSALTAYLVIFILEKAIKFYKSNIKKMKQF